jgi:hypothetical protein
MLFIYTVMNVIVDTMPGLPKRYDFFAKYGTNPIILILLAIIIILYYFLFSSLGKDDLGELGLNPFDKSNPSITFLGTIMWSFFLVLVFLNAVQYFFNIDITTSIRNIISPQPEIDIKVSEEGKLKTKGTGTIDRTQVFHVPDNKYTYKNAEAVCKAYGAELADYKDVEDAYENGAEWCSYGWSQGQHALFPTQKKTWNALQKIEGHEHNCGRPGVNGGFIDNENVRFGVNCKGNKPEMNEEEASRLANDPIYPKSKADIELEKRVKYWRTKIPDILLAPYNKQRWNRV